MTKEIQGLTRVRTQWVKVTEIHTRPDDFQHRASVCNEYHADELARALKSKQELPPVDVWRDPETRELIIIDGHHRHEAHIRASRQKVRVAIHEGPERDAVLYALKANSETKLPMAAWERSDAAWRLVCKTESGEDEGPSVYSKAELVKNSQVSNGTIGTMRSTRKKLLEAGQDLPRTWEAAQMLLRREAADKLTDEDFDEMTKARAEKLYEKFGKEIGREADINIDAVEMALAWCLGSKGEHMVEAWRTDFPDIDDGEEALF